MGTSPVRTYSNLYAHVARLTLRAVGSRAPYLLVAPAVALLLDFIAPYFTNLVAGLIYFLIECAALSLVLFVGRAIIEQRKMSAEDLQTGLGAFFNDMTAVFFAFWIVDLVLSYVLHMSFLSYPLFLACVVLSPLFETAALAPVGSYAIFEAAFSFVRRDAGPWLLGQVVLLPLAAAWFALATFVPFGGGLLEKIVFWIFVLIAFVYRGVLFLTLDGTSPRRRAQRFGGEPGLG